MLLAVLEDFAQLPGCRVATTWDRRLGRCPLQGKVEVFEIQRVAEEKTWFCRLAGECGSTLMIAPEFDDLLGQRVRLAREVGGGSLGCLPEAIDLCADKLRVSEHLQSQAIRTVESLPFEPGAPTAGMQYPAVVKPRFGAGAQHTFLVDNDFELERVCVELMEAFPGGAMIAQPFVPGGAVSLGLMIHGSAQRIDILPPGDQHIRLEDGRFQYFGGRIPADLNHSRRVELEHLARDLVGCIDGLNGWIGIDLILPEDDSEKAVVVDINPRLTTAYLGYRELMKCNLAARMLFQDATGVEPVEHGRTVQFTPDGVCNIVS